MNGTTIKNIIKKAGMNVNEWQVEKGYKCYNIYLATYGLTDSERMEMTGDEVNTKRQSDNNKVQAIADLFNVQPERSGIKVNTELAPSTW